MVEKKGGVEECGGLSARPRTIVTSNVVCDKRWYFLLRYPNDISCFLAVVRFPSEI
jgi:hypothetical protein